MSIKHSNIVYNFGASGNCYLYAMRLCFLLSLLILRSHDLCKGSTSYKIRYLLLSPGSVEQQIHLNGFVSHLSLFSTCDQSNLTPAALVGCRVAKSAFFNIIGLLLNCFHGMIFPSGLKVLNIAYITFD